MRNYIELTYGNKPWTDYPKKLAEYLAGRYDFYGMEIKGILKQRPYLRILDVGCGRGEYLNAFIRMGYHGCGIDQEPYQGRKGHIEQWDIESGIGNAYREDSFDVILIKSVIEHLDHPEYTIDECFELLNPGGIIIVMTPDWRQCYRDFYGDFQHKSPFTQNSLDELLQYVGFDDVECEHFLQSPPLWKRPWLMPIFKTLAFFRWPHRNMQFSRQSMLLATGRKPSNTP